MEGHKFMFDKKLVTVWSAPNYCYRMNNLASIMDFDQNMEYKFKDFKAVEESASSVNPKNLLPYFL